MKMFIKIMDMSRIKLSKKKFKFVAPPKLIVSTNKTTHDEQSQNRG